MKKYWRIFRDGVPYTDKELVQYAVLTLLMLAIAIPLKAVTFGFD